MSILPFMAFLMGPSLLGAFVLGFVKDHYAQRVGVAFSIMTFVMSLTMTASVDNLSLPFVLLTTSVIPLSMMIRGPQKPLYYSLFLLLESLLLGAFTSVNLLSFYVFFEASVVPLFFLMGLWGGAGRLEAALKFFLYTAAGSLLMLMGLLILYHYQGTFDLKILQMIHFPLEIEKCLWILFFLAFSIKMPLWPLHTWLPDAHSEASTGVSMVLAGIVLKLGGYGMVRYLIPLFPTASHLYAPVVFALSSAGLIVMAVVAFRQTDMKRLVAYLSIAHMAIVTFGIFSHHPHGITGAVVQMISHGLTSSALFLLVGILYQSYGTYAITAYKGLLKTHARWSILFILVGLSAMGFPLTSGFVGEFLVVLGLFNTYPLWASVAAVSFLLNGIVMIFLWHRILFGVATEEEKPEILHWNEGIILGALILTIFVLGVKPGLIGGLGVL